MKETTWVCRHTVTGAPVERGWTIVIEGKPSVVVNVDSGLVDHPTDRPEALVGGADRTVPEGVTAPPGLVVPAV